MSCRRSKPPGVPPLDKQLQAAMYCWMARISLPQEWISPTPDWLQNTIGQSWNHIHTNNISSLHPFFFPFRPELSLYFSSFWTSIVILFINVDVLLSVSVPPTNSPGMLEISRKLLVCPVSTFQLHYLWIVRWFKSATIPLLFSRCALPSHTAMTSAVIVVLSFIYKAQLIGFRLCSQPVLYIAPRSVGSERWYLCQLTTCLQITQ